MVATDASGEHTPSIGGVSPRFVREPVAAWQAWSSEARPTACFYLADPVTQVWARNLAEAVPGQVLVLESGEAAKSWATLERILAWLMDHNADRSAVLVVMGGGALSDVGGMAAALFKRGIPWVSIPTTLLAMVDAAYGGKCAINFGSIKNSIGLYYEPILRLYSTAYLQSLPPQAIFDGWAEILKHGLIASPELMSRNESFLKHAAGPTEAKLESPTEEHLMEALLVKIKWVELDPRESGPRKILNFGHTMGHALETLMPHLGHGRAVWLGMLYECALSVNAGCLNQETAQRCYEHLLLLLPFVDDALIKSPWPAWESLWKPMLQDKKNHGGLIRWTLPVAWGLADYDRIVDPKQAQQVYEFWIRNPFVLPLLNGRSTL
ncbi:MAG: 3-dehydroquinate synthase [Bacteroidia bacterium]